MVLDANKVEERDVVQVEYRTRRFDGMPDGSRARGDAIRYESLVLGNEALQQAFERRHPLERLDIEQPKLLNINWPAILLGHRMTKSEIKS